MSPESYLASTWREIICTIHGYQKRLQVQNREGWRQARMICYYSVLPYDSKKQLKSPESLFGIIGDKVESEGVDTEVNEQDLMALNIPAGARINYKSNQTKEDWDEKVKLTLARRQIEKEGKIKKQKSQNAKPR